METPKVKRAGRPKGPAADTKALIIKAASQIFSEKGFAGASVSEIAKSAHINQSLIYHHFENKLDLWQAVKAHLIEKHKPKYLLGFNAKTLEAVIEEYVNSRFDFYAENSQVLRMLLWQRLDVDQERLATSAAKARGGELYKRLKVFQEHGDVKENIDLEYAIAMFGDMVTAPLFAFGAEFGKRAAKTREYKSFVVNSILNVLKK